MNNKYDDGLDELLDQLQRHPEIVKELIFEPNNCRRLVRKLRNKRARHLLSEPVQDFLDYIAGADDGYPIAQCFLQTVFLCAKGTGHGLCGGGTKSGCGGRTGRN